MASFLLSLLQDWRVPPSSPECPSTRWPRWRLPASPTWSPRYSPRSCTSTSGTESSRCGWKIPSSKSLPRTDWKGCRWDSVQDYHSDLAITVVPYFGGDQLYESCFSPIPEPASVPEIWLCLALTPLNCISIGLGHELQNFLTSRAELVETFDEPRVEPRHEPSSRALLLNKMQ